MKNSTLNRHFKSCGKFVLLFVLVFFISIYQVLAQQKTITGKVVDESNRPLSNVSIVIKGQPGVGTSTDENGKYNVSASNTDVLVFTSIGLNTVEKPVGNEVVINVTMKETATNLNELVVVGYGTTTRKNLTTAIAKVDTKKVPLAANSSLAQLVFGRAAGVQAVQQSAEPGGLVNMSIRGRGNPLVVVDGVIVPYTALEPGSGNQYMNGGVTRGGLGGINPEDIESIEFLKDASASIYGVNASNGVVLVTTKKGNSGRINVSYDGSYSFVTNNKYMEPLSAYEYMTNYNRLTQDKYLADSAMIPFGTKPVDLTHYPAAWHPFSNEQITNNTTETDWLGYVLRNGSITNHVISINGGNDKVVYYFSAGYFAQQGTMQNSNLTKYTEKLNVTFNVAKFLSVTTNINYGRNSYLNSQAGAQTSGIGQQGFGALQSALAYPSYLPLYDTLTGKYSIFRISGNPKSLLDIKDETTNFTLFGTISADFKIIPNVLTGKLLYGNNLEGSDRNYYLPSTVYYNQQYRSFGSATTAKRQMQTLEATLSFKKSYGEYVDIDAIAGYGEYPSTYYSFGASGYDMLDAIGTDNLGSASLSSQTINSSRSSSKFRSYFARGNFDFVDKYVLGISYRYDGYNQFFPENKFASFPAASAAWKISNESFMKGIKAINLLKLRASIGITGNASGIAYGSFSPEYNVIAFTNGTVSYVPYYLTQLDNPGLRWPKTVNKNIGLDYRIFIDRISGSFDWFRDDITRLVVYQTTAPLSLIPTAPINSGHQVRTGWEIGLNTVNIKSDNFQWNTGLNITHVNYRWEERYANTYLKGYQNVKDPVNSIYYFETSGILQDIQSAPDYQPAGAKFPGCPIFVDQNGDNSLDSNDVKRVNANPTLTIGFENTFRYKNFDLMIMMYGQFGGHAYNVNASWTDPNQFITGYVSGIKQLSEVWSSSNTEGTRPGIVYNESALALETGTDIGLEKTDFVRCRNINFGYTVNTKTFSRFVNSLRIYIDVQNPFIITKYTIFDPELTSYVVKGGPAPYPMSRTYSLGLKANF
jgi:TonB-linked SusC/RagA family outer membrane protein